MVTDTQKKHIVISFMRWYLIPLPRITVAMQSDNQMMDITIATYFNYDWYFKLYKIQDTRDKR